MDVEENVWLRPQDFDEPSDCNRYLEKSRRWAEVVIFVFAVACAVFCCTKAEFKENHPLMYWYMVATLTVDVVHWGMWSFISGSMLLLCGEVAIVHSASVRGVFYQVTQGLINYASVTWGCWVLYHEWHSKEDIPIVGMFYVFLEVTVSMLFTLEVLPVLIGVAGFVNHKLQDALSRRPIVQFGRIDTPFAYFYNLELSQYRDSLAEMENPTTPQRRTRDEHSGVVRVDSGPAAGN
eukprot:Lankesteria_metandrocarpae@DN7087_c0_g1_i1.p1